VSRNIYRESFRGATQYQVTSRFDEVNYNVHVDINNQDTRTTRKPLSTFKKNTRGSLKSVLFF